MNALEAGLRHIGESLARTQRNWALIGGLAVSARIAPRFTRDVDLAVSVTGDDIAEELVRSLLSSDYELLASIEQDAVGRLATVRLIDNHPDSQALVVDLLFASCGIESEIAEHAEHLEVVPNVVVPVATIGHLIALKILARDDERRPQDLADLRALMVDATHADLDNARAAVDLITNRGFHRGRDLAASLRELIDSSQT